MKKTLFVPSVLLASVVATGFSACRGGNSTTAATAPSQSSRPTSIPLKFVGLIMPTHDKGATTAVFRDSVGHVVSGREGDFIEGRYRITRIMTDAVEITEITNNARPKTIVPFTHDETSTTR